MSDYMDRVRLVVTKLEDESYPLVVGAISESIWEVIPPEEWDAIKCEWLQKWLGPDWTAYDAIEVVAVIPAARLSEFFAPVLDVVDLAPGESA
jgi:hypothetical protein